MGLLAFSAVGSEEEVEEAVACDLLRQRVNVDGLAKGRFPVVVGMIGVAAGRAARVRVEVVVIYAAWGRLSRGVGGVVW